MESMETLQQALRRLGEAGYRDQFRVEDDRLRARDAERSYEPESLKVDEIVRFEGASDPSDQSAVFALRSEDGVRGTYTVAYGPDMPAADARVVPRLSTAAGRTAGAGD